MIFDMIDCLLDAFSEISLDISIPQLESLIGAC
jgi:hypothetical protein